MVEGHGVRERHVRGPRRAESAAEFVTLAVRRYRCRRCGAITTVLPTDLIAGRHYSASAIGLALGLFGLLGYSQDKTRQRICPWAILGFTAVRAWAALRYWVGAIDRRQLFPPVRRSPPDWSLRQRAERAAATLLGLAPGTLIDATIEERVFAGAALCR